MRVLVSVVVERFRAFRRALARHGAREPGRVGSRVLPPEWLMAKMGGRVLVLDWDARRIDRELPVPTAQALCWPAGRPLLVSSGWDDVVHRFPGGIWRDPRFSDVHSLVPDGEGLLMTCSASDALHRTSTGWTWSPHAETRRRVATLDRLVHPNSALPDGDAVLATFFHPGQIVRITGQRVEVVRSGLDHPHGLRRFRDGYVVSDTGAGCVRVLDAAFRDVAVLDGLDWAQDAHPTPRDTLLVIDDVRLRGDEPADATHRILEWSPERGVLGHWDFPIDQRLFQLLIPDHDEPLDA